MKEIEIEISKLFEGIQKLENHQFKENQEYFQKENILIQDENDNWININMLIIKKDKIVNIKFDNGESIKVAKNHLLRELDNICKNINQSKVGDLFQKASGTIIKIISIEEFTEDFVYDICVDNFTHLYQDANGFVHHNSTILRYIAGLQKPTSGQILINDRPQTEKDHINMIFQKYSSFEWMTVLENVELGLKFKGVPKKQRREQAMEMIKIVDLEDHVNKYAKYGILSGGQLQRVAIARSLLADKRVLLMDEPFGALDIKTRLKMQDKINEIWENLSKLDGATTIILVTHDISEAVYLGDDIYIMSAKPGQLIDYIHVDLPQERNKAIKRTDRFVELVRLIEDKMAQLTN